MKTFSRPALMAAACSLTMISAGCTATGTAVKRTLPAPSLVVMDPVPVPVGKRGQDARAVLAKTGAALGEANVRLVKSREIYTGIVETYSAE